MNITTIKQLDEQIGKNDKVLVDFYAEWCGPCKAMKPTLEKMDDNNPDILILKVDVDSSKELTEEYKIRSIPTFVTFKNGEVTNVKSGLMTDKQIIEMFE